MLELIYSRIPFNGEPVRNLGRRSETTGPRSHSMAGRVYVGNLALSVTERDLEDEVAVQLQGLILLNDILFG